MISNNKLLHSIGVARKCEQIAKNKNLSQEMQDACFVMGFLHDIGYERIKDDNISDHPKESYNLLKSYEKYKDSIDIAIANHGRCLGPMTIFDEILNTADMTVNHIGETVSLKNRLDGIMSHHGENSSHFQHASQQADMLPFVKAGYTDPMQYYNNQEGE